MSEFSESYHLCFRSQKEAVERLAATPLEGVVLPTDRLHTPFLVHGDPVAIGRHLKGERVVHYRFAEDHGEWVTLYAEGRKIATMSETFEDRRQRKFDPRPWLDAGLLNDAQAAFLMRDARRRQGGGRSSPDRW